MGIGGEIGFASQSRFGGQVYGEMTMKRIVFAIALASAFAAPAFAQDEAGETEMTAEEQAAFDAEKDNAVASDEGTGLSVEEEAVLDADKAASDAAAGDAEDPQ
jgi:Ni/Co efflux regulator RcnB